MAAPKRGAKAAATYDPGEHSGGGKGSYPYAEIQKRVPEAQLKAYASFVRKRFEEMAKRWNPTRNAEWSLRAYAALKHVMSATVALGAARAFADEEAPEPAEYPERVHDGVVGAARALSMFLPDAPWDDGGLLDLPIRLFARLLRGSLAPMDANVASWVGEVIERSAAFREALGEEGEEAEGEGKGGELAAVEIVRLDVAVPFARLFCELAQWHSEIMAAALAKHVEPPVGYDFGVLISAGKHVDEAGIPIVGDEDGRRIGELFGTAPYPDNLRALAWERLWDTAEALWSEASVRAGGAELDRSLIFPIPGSS
jgi:hypothetical protein